MATADKPYKIRPEHEGLFVISTDEQSLNADEYHKVPGGTIVPQMKPEGGIEYGGDNKQDIPMFDVSSNTDGDVKTSAGVFRKPEKQTMEAPPDNVAPSGLVAPASQPAVPPLPKRKLIKVTLDSKLFGKIVIPALESLLGEGCTVLVTDSSDGFSFIPPVSETPFKVIFEGDKEGTEMFYCGQTFLRPSLNEQYLLLIHADKN